MMTPTPLRAAAFAVLMLALPLHAEPTPATPPASASADPSGDAIGARHAQDLRELMVALRIFKRMQREPTNWGAMSAPDREFSTALRRAMTEDEVHRRMLPAYAALFSPKQAADLARLSRSPAWRKREQRLQELPSGTTVYLHTFMTPAEIAETRRIDATPAMVALSAGQKTLHQKHQQMLNRWSDQFDDELHAKLVSVLRKVRSDLAANREARSGGTITIGRVGVPYADKYAYVAGGAIIALENAYNRFEDRLKAMGFEDILKSEYLASKVSLAHSRTVVEDAEKALEALLKEVDLAIKEREQELSKLVLPQQNASSRMIEGSTGNAYGYMVDFGEAYRRLLDDQRRLLAFIAERSGKVYYEDGKLMFTSDADLVVARALFDQLEVTRGALIALVEGQTKKEVDAERRQRGERIDTAPKEAS